jgi:DNA-binding CsgD family transcriptional regulator
MFTFTQVMINPAPDASLEADAALHRQELKALAALRPLGDAAGAGDIADALRNFAAALGALHHAFLVVDRSADNLPALWLCDDLGGWWKDLIPPLHDLLAPRPLGGVTPLSHTWFCVRPDRREDEPANYAALRKLGVRRGLLVPSEARRPCEVAGCILLAFADNVASQAARKNEHYPACIAHAASLALDAYRRLPHPPSRKSPLSARESECLRWASIGKTSWETACILGVSERTVNFHLGNTFLKLNVTNKQAAVAQAILQGLI